MQIRKHRNFATFQPAFGRNRIDLRGGEVPKSEAGRAVAHALRILRARDGAASRRDSLRLAALAGMPRGPGNFTARCALG
jgi:hypothetical protein